MTTRTFKNKDETKAVKRLINELTKYLVKNIEQANSPGKSNISNSTYIDFGKILEPSLKVRISDHENVSCCETPDFEISVAASEHGHYEQFVEIDGEWQYTDPNFMLTYKRVIEKRHEGTPWSYEIFRGVEIDTDQFKAAADAIKSKLNS